jgi:hypothetical protein
MSAKKLAEHFSELEDPRCSGKGEHLLIDILVIPVCAVIAGAESWVDMALYDQKKADWLSTFLRLPNGIPAHETFRRVFMLIDPEDFESRFTVWMQAFAVSVDREVVAIDGKTVRGSFDRSRDQGPLHIVGAWASERGLVLGQRQVGDKSNEITAVPDLLDTLDLTGQHRDLGRDGLPKGDRQQDPGTGRRLSGHAQGQSGQDLCRGARSLLRNLFWTWLIQPAGLGRVR